MTPRPDHAAPDPTRDAALALLVAVFERRQTLEEALSAVPAVEPRDRAAAHRLAAAVLRRTATLDAVLERHLGRAPPERVRQILRIGAASLLLLDTPPHAAVGTAVALARRARLPAFAGLVNAILRKVAAEGAAALDGLDGPRLDTPAWLWRSWGVRARAIATGHQSEAPIDLGLRPGVSAPPGSHVLPGQAARLPPGTRITSIEGFEQGAFWVQDVAASLPARLLGEVAGRTVCDLCAAPGGKTAQLALAGARVTAVDRDPVRMRRLAENRDRLRLDVELVEADANAYRPSRRFDAVLLDAPCSATGTIRRHPEIMRLRRESDIATLAARQDALLASAADLVSLGGTLVYAVCSLQPEEGPGVIGRALAGGDWRADPIDPAELPGFEPCVTPDGTLRTDPGMWAETGGMDGFFAARLTRA